MTVSFEYEKNNFDNNATILKNHSFYKILDTFFLNKNAKWSNGDPVIAQDFVWSWMRILTPSLGSQYPDMLYYLKGAEDFHQGRTSNFYDVGVNAINDHELRVELKNPTPFFIIKVLLY